MMSFFNKTFQFFVLYLLTLSPASAIAQNNHAEPDVIIYMNDFPPFSNISEKGEPEGKWVEMVVDYIEQTGLSYTIDIIPWQRAYFEATTKDNVLIAHMDRTEEREDKFYWLLPITSLTYSLLAPKNSQFANQSLDEIISGYGTVLCSEGTSHCDILKNIGFPNDRIIEIATYDGTHFHKLIRESRADFMLEDFTSMKMQMDKIGLDSSSISELYPIKTITSYLSVSKNINPEFLKHLPIVTNDGEGVE